LGLGTQLQRRIEPGGPMRRTVRVVFTVLALVTGARVALAKCNPSVDPDRADIANARAAVAADCDCSVVTKHHAYVGCAGQQASAALINKSCVGVVKKCASHSSCGKANAVTCCLSTAKGTTCKIKPDAAHCTAKQGTIGTCTSCCDACPTPGSGPSCPVPTTTTTTLQAVCGDGIIEYPP